MTKRSRIYFNFKAAFRLTGTVAGRRKLAAMGVHPIGFTVSSFHIPGMYTHGYFIDRRGRIVGTSNKKTKAAPPIWVNLPALQPTTCNYRIELTSPDVLNDAP